MPFNPALAIPTGENTALGIGKETTPGLAVVPTLWHAHTGFNASEKNTPVQRPGARKRLGQTYPATGAYTLKIALSVESDPDTVAQLLAFGMGGQGTPSTTMISTTLSSAAAMSATSISVVSTAGMVPGAKITVGTATASTIASVSPPNTVTLTAGLSAAQTMGATVSSTGTTGYAQTLKLGTPLPSFSIQINRVTDAVVYYGCKVGSFDFAMDPKGGLVVKFTIDAIGAAIVGSPGTPTYSTKYPFLFHNSNSYFVYNNAQAGLSGQVSVQNWGVSINNALVDSYYSFGNGRFKLAIPENQRTVTGKATLGFETNAAYLNFWGGATAPANAIPAVPIEAFVVSTDIADTPQNQPFTIDFLMANCFLESDDPDIKPSGIITQPLTWMAAETAAGAQDDLKISVINTNSAIY